MENKIEFSDLSTVSGQDSRDFIIEIPNEQVEISHEKAIHCIECRLTQTFRKLSERNL